ncbi:hypothetical protein PV05_02649 [Exophiala xenobiotica]|uniref:PH domain-containing protein n=1 Tax=Exophiala xenobiotica TaxID=348802 RepID=A0A0D2FDH3_9EURO|nr:uncharacterized protein PV05_02649 [Exophiala xenobiotica]KIW58099.1 hypothetical protein PV05_02649 [Exophiala xenobiotica]
MSSTTSFPPLPSPGLEQSGWWPSERGAKSRFRAFFSRTKSQDKVPRQYVETFPPHPSVQPLEPAAKRSRSTTWSKGPKQPPRNVTSDPPPLFHAYTQARMHEILDIPSSFTDGLFRNGHTRRNSISSETPSRSSLENASEEPSFKHNRNWSGASTCSLSQRLFILTTSGYVLQYTADGLNDRLPEKILELGPGSVAFASDAIPGKHWVLQISRDGRAHHTHQANKGSWSKWSFKHPDNKKAVGDLLLVFDDAASFKDWLQAVRKEIADLGGLEYRPDSRQEDARSERQSLKAQRSLPSLSQSTPHLPVSAQPQSPTLLPPMTRWTTSRNVSRSTTESSIHTLNDLDRLRKPSFSDNQSVSTTHTSFTGSTISYRDESFSSVDDNPLPTYPPTRLSTPTQDEVGELSMFMATPKKTIHIPKRIIPQENHPDVISHDLFVQSNDSSSTTIAHKSRPISTVAPLPEPGHIRKISARYRYEAAPLPTQPNTPTSSRPSSIRSRSSSYTSFTQDSSPGGTRPRTASYSLFPKTSSTEPSQIYVPSGMPSPPATTPGTAYESMCTYPYSQDVTDEEKSRPSSRVSRTTSRRNGKMLSVDSKAAQSTTTDQPQRSPAVTDAHVETCFGTQAHPSAPRRKLSAKGSMGVITTTTLEASPLPNVPTLSQPPRKARHVKGQKSMPALHRSVTMLPLGPPPTGPLPALPVEATSCLPLKKLSCMSSSGSGSQKRPRPPPKHAKAESSDAVFTLRKVQDVSAAPMPTPTPLDLLNKPLPMPKREDKVEPEEPAKIESAAHHTRNMSSLSSVGSVRHVTAWLASPRVAEFSAKYGLDDSDKENENGKESEHKFLQVALPDGLGFSAEFEEFIAP